MRLKLDENLGRSVGERCVAAGHDVTTVVGQGLAGCADARLLAVCGQEGRVLVTLDLDFANPLRFDPASSPGIAVLRIPDSAGRWNIRPPVERLLTTLASADIAGRLWVVRADRVRQYESE